MDMALIGRALEKARTLSEEEAHLITKEEAVALLALVEQREELGEIPHVEQELLDRIRLLLDAWSRL